jgi:predicted molibdopterin-dependent oxidoreductase YjgC
MDPRGQALRRHATHMLQFKPGADVSMLNAIMHVIVEEGLYDRQYIEAMTENWEAMKPSIWPASRPRRWKRSAASRRDPARRRPRLRPRRRGHDLLGHGHQPARPRHRQFPLPDLARADVRPCRPAGHRAASAAGQNNVQGASDAGLIPMFLPDYQSVTDDAVRAVRAGLGRGRLVGQKGLTVTEILDAVHEGQIRGMYILGENPAMSDPDVEPCARGAGEAGASGGAGHLPDRDRQLRRRDPARRGLLREDRHRDQHQPAGADGPSRRAAARRGARGLGDHRRPGAEGWARLVLYAIRARSSPR